MTDSRYILKGGNRFPPIEREFLKTKMDEFCSINGKKAADPPEEEITGNKKAGKGKLRANQLQVFLAGVISEYQIKFPYRHPDADVSKYPKEQRDLQYNLTDWGKLGGVSIRASRTLSLD